MVSLRWREERRARLAAQARGVEFVDAVDGLALNATAAPPGLKRGELACFLSHVGMWRRLVRSGRQLALVLEDDADVRLPQQWADIMGAMAAAPPGWEVLHLGGVGGDHWCLLGGGT